MERILRHGVDECQIAASPHQRLRGGYSSGGSDILKSCVQAYAPVVKRTSRRSPEPQVRVRLPAGAFI